jgi:hypothetical protein
MDSEECPVYRSQGQVLLNLFSSEVIREKHSVDIAEGESLVENAGQQSRRTTLARQGRVTAEKQEIQGCDAASSGWSSPGRLVCTTAGE